MSMICAFGNAPRRRYFIISSVGTTPAVGHGMPQTLKGATMNARISSIAFWTLALSGAITACSAETLDDTASAQTDSRNPQRQALTTALRENQAFLSLTAELQERGYEVRLEDASYETDEGTYRNPETNETVANVETLIIPVVDADGREMAVLRKSASSSDDEGAAFAPAASDIDSSRLNKVLDDLSALEDQDDTTSTERPERRVMAASRGCYPWTCYFTSRRIWTISCLTRVAGGWAKVPASVWGYSVNASHSDFMWFADYRGRGIACPSHNTGKKEGYRVCCSTLPCP